MHVLLSQQVSYKVPQTRATSHIIARSLSDNY